MEADLADVIAFIMGICMTLLMTVGTDFTRPTSPSASNARYASSELAKTRQALAETNVPVGKDVSCKLRWRVSRRLRRVRPTAQQHALIQVARGIMFFSTPVVFFKSSSDVQGWLRAEREVGELAQKMPYARRPDTV